MAVRSGALAPWLAQDLTDKGRNSRAPPGRLIRTSVHRPFVQLHGPGLSAWSLAASSFFRKEAPEPARIGDHEPRDRIGDLEKVSIAAHEDMGARLQRRRGDQGVVGPQDRETRARSSQRISIVLPKHLAQVDLADRLVPGAHGEAVGDALVAALLSEAPDLDRLALRVHDPVFADALALVEAALDAPVAMRRGGERISTTRSGAPTSQRSATIPRRSSETNRRSGCTPSPVAGNSTPRGA